jgi:FkbM family methyltransferase
MKRWVRQIRDNALILKVCVASLQLLRSLGLMRARRIYSHVPFRGTVTVDCGSGRSFRIESRGHNIENGLYWDGLFAHEPESMTYWVRYAERADVVLDIGANSGVFALAAAAAGARHVHAFEPVPRIHGILTENFVLNDCNRLHAWPYAVGASVGKAMLFDPGGDAPTSASLSPEFIRERFGMLPEVEVSVVSIDEFCAERGIGKVDLIKIDVEGYEEFALRGMRRIVLMSRPVILLEVLDGQEIPLRELLDSLWPDLYSWSRIDEGPNHVSRNVLLRPNPSK